MNQGGIIEPIPITQEDKARLGVDRNRALKRWKLYSIIAAVAAVVAIGLGIAQLALSEITMYSFGAPIIAGGLTFFLVFFILGAIYEGRKYPEGDDTGGCFKCCVGCYFITAIFVIIIGMILALFSLIGTIKCFMPPTSEYDVLASCDDGVKAITIAGIVTLLVLTIINCVGSCVYCCNTRAFGFKSRNEIMLQYQVQMMTEVQRQQGQQLVPQTIPPGYQPAAGMYQQQGYQPQPDQYYQHEQEQYHHSQQDHHSQHHDRPPQHGQSYYTHQQPHQNEHYQSQQRSQRQPYHDGHYQQQQDQHDQGLHYQGQIDTNTPVPLGDKIDDMPPSYKDVVGK